VTGAFVAGTNRHGGSDESSVTCPDGGVAIGIVPVQQAWNTSAACVPIASPVQLDPSSARIQWFSTPGNSTVGCSGSSFATATFCCGGSNPGVR
jgi:hypothetical protein